MELKTLENGIGNIGKWNWKRWKMELGTLGNEIWGHLKILENGIWNIGKFNLGTLENSIENIGKLKWKLEILATGKATIE